MTSFNDWPPEVISHIMRFLSVPDRKDLALVNRGWYEASLDPVLQRDVVVNLQTFLNNHGALNGVLKPRRPAANMLLVDGLGDNDSWQESCKQFGTSLLSLSVRGCDITESTFVTLLSYCHCLTSLDLTGCNSPFMTGKFLEKESDRDLLKKSLANVKELSLASLRYLSNVTFNRLVSVLGKLEKLDLSYCQILFHSTKTASYTDGTLFTFDNILVYFETNPTKLKSLALRKTAITNRALRSLAGIEGLRLESIDLSYCRDISNEGLKELCEKQNGIEYLNLTGCPEIGDVVVEEIIRNLLRVKELTLKQCAFVTDRSVKKLNSLTTLRLLNLAGVHRPSHIGLTNGLGSSKLSSLASLCLSGNSAVNDSVVLSLCVSLRRLRSLDLSSCFYVTDRGLVAIFHYLDDLRDLNLAHCKKITDLGLLGLRAREDDHETHTGACKCDRPHSAHVFQLGIKVDDIPNITLKQVDELQNKVHSEVASLRNLTRLRTLNLQGISNVSDLSLTQALEFASLTTLNLNMCCRVGDSSLFSIANKNPNLENIQLGSSGAGDVGVKFLVETLPRLRTLVLSNCDRVSDVSITAIGNSCRRLKYLDVSFCGSVSESALEYLDERLPNLLEMHRRYIKTE